MDFLDYREKLGIGFCDEEKVGFVITNLISYAKVRFSYIGVDKFVYYILDTGSPIRQKELTIGDGLMDEDRGNAIVNILLAHQDILEDFLSYFIPLINRCDEETQAEHKRFLETIFKAAHIPYEIFKDKDGYFIFPKGAEELDSALVSEPLRWMEDYPKAHKTYCTALKQYSDGEYIRDVADNLRKALETFLQEFLNNDKNLETNKNEICKYLGLQGVDAGIGGLFQPLINSYKNINDRIAKHNDKVDKKLLEFLLYQTGVLIRMVLVIKQAETEEFTHAD